MKKVFIDCGGHLGESVKKFKSSSLYSEDFIIYSFEPLIYFLDQYKDPSIISINKAIWIKDGILPFYIDKTNNVARGSTLIKNKTSGKLDKENPIFVECIDFSHWILNTFDRNDCLILKMDIEGAEYDILNKMIVDNSISYINKAYIEFHWKKIGLSYFDHEKIISKLRNVSSLKLYDEFTKMKKV
jgi:FkbM family methyltransferase